MPISLVLPPFAMLPHSTLLDWVMKSMFELFKRLGDRLAARQLSVAAMVRETASIPVLAFEGDAVTATLDRSQYGALAVAIPGSLKMEVKEDPSQAAFGLGRIPAGFDAGLSISGLLKAMAVLLEHIKQYATTDEGSKLRHLVGPTGAYTVFMSNPSSPMVPAMIAAAPRFAGAIASIIQNLADFVDTIGSSEGSKRIGGFADGLGALKQALASTSKSGKGNSNAEEATDLVGLARDASRYIGLALVGIPWLSLYVPALFRTAMIALRLLTLAAVEKIERQVWELRKTLLKLFYVDLEVYRRMALSYLKTAQEILQSQFGYYTAFAETYLFELVTNLTDWAKKLTEMFGKIIKYIQYFAVVVAAIGEVFAPNSTAAAAAAAAPPPPKPFAPFPDLSETLFGPRAGNGLLRVVGGVRGLALDFVSDILSSGVELLNNSASTFTALREAESRVSVARPFAHVLREGEARVQDVMAPTRAWMKLQEQRPNGLTGLAAPFEAALAPPGAMQAPFGSALAAGGFQLIGAAIPGYVKGLRDFWLRERSTGQRPTSPHLLAKHARHLQVRMPDLTIKATGRPADGKLATVVAGRFRAAIDDAYRAGREKFLAAPAG